MNAPAIFGFIVRLIGLYFLYRATSLAVELFTFAFASSRVAAMVSPGWSSVMGVLGYLLAAMWFFKGVPPYSGWAYGELSSKKD